MKKFKWSSKSTQIAQTGKSQHKTRSFMYTMENKTTTSKKLTTDHIIQNARNVPKVSANKRSNVSPKNNQMREVKNQKGLEEVEEYFMTLMITNPWTLKDVIDLTKYLTMIVKKDKL